MNISNACLRLATYIRRTTRRRISSTAMEYTQIAKMQNRLLDLQTENHICILCSILFPTLLLYIGDGIYWRQLLLTQSKCCNNGHDCIRIVRKTCIPFGRQQQLRHQPVFAKENPNKLCCSMRLPNLNYTVWQKRILLRLFI